MYRYQQVEKSREGAYLVLTGPGQLCGHHDMWLKDAALEPCVSFTRSPSIR